MRDKAMLEEILVELAQRVRTQSLNLAHAALGAIEQFRKMLHHLRISIERSKRRQVFVGPTPEQ